MNPRIHRSTASPHPRFPRPVLALLLLLPIAAAAALPGADVRRDPVVQAVERVLPAVVNIGTLAVERADPYEQMLREFFGYRRRAPDTLYSSGSGVVIDEEGWVLTNFHVIRDAARVRVTFSDRPDPIDAQVVSVSEANDLALLRLAAQPGQRFPSLPFAADDDLLLGETVIALGNPYGLGGSVSRGILSSKTRRAERDGEPMAPEDWLQTDASINPGNSGGPLVNLRGELIGLNVAILAQAQGIGFAIPIKRINAALTGMFSPEATRGLWFGATVRGSRPPLLIAEIQRDSPADTAGLEPGDEILSLDGRSPRSALQFYRALGATGDTARLVILRGDQRRQLNVRLLAEASVFNADYLRRRLGLSLEPVPADIQRQLRLDLSAALIVADVERSGPGATAGLTRGQILTALDGHPPRDIVILGRSLHRRPPGDTVTLDLLSARRRGMLLSLSEARARLRLR
ncbi:MAG: trypsin-like peptidase domain-containing protein [Verrucomicrobiae bacterium]|nr:trypsin-like peptidase domain-containing protein [Verrucomicrobiae bacterium]